MGLTKQQLEALNVSSFPDNTSELITPQILRDYNSASIVNTVNQDTYTTDSASFDARINAITSSVINTGSFATTGSNIFVGDQIVKGDITISGSSDLTNNNHLNFTRYNSGGDIFRIGVSDNGNTYDFTITGSTNQQMWLIDNQGGTYINTFQSPIIATNNVRLDAGFTASLQDGYAWVGNSSGKNSQVPTSSFGTAINTGSFATTGSNTFYGTQIFSGSGFTLFINDTGSNSIAQLGGNISRFPQLYANSIYPINIESDNGNNISVNLSAGGGTNGGVFKVNAVSGSQFTGSINVSGSVDITGQFLINGIPISGSNISGFATTGSNTFTGNQTISNKKIVFDTTGSVNTNGIEFVNSKIYQNNFLNFETQGNVGVDFSANNATDSAVNINFRNNNPNGAIQLTTNNGGYIKIDASTNGGNVNISGSNLTLNNVDFIPFSASLNTRINSTTTYTNPSLNPYSGSLILVANTFTSSSFAHISASANGQVNLVFKNNNNTGTTILSGSNNIFTNPGSPSAGFIRYIGGSDNLIQNANAVPQITASAQFSPAFNSNIINSNNTNFFMRAPVSASVGWTIRNNYIGGATINLGTAAVPNPGINQLNFANNSIAGGNVTFTTPINLVSNTGFSNNYINGALTLQLNSSSIAMAFCNINDSGFTLTNNSWDTSTGGGVGTGSLAFNRLNIGGSGNTITARNAGTMSSYSDNVIFGASNQIALDISQTNNAFNANQIMGKNLIVTASGVFPDSNGQYVGSMFIGRNNAVDGNKGLTAQTVFAVGTGTNTTTGRKTGFLIDSGSNTFVEGTLNVSGSTSLTGSLTIQSGSGDLYVYGHKQYNCGQFQTNVTQSGSAAVSQSIQFEVTDLSYGVSMVSGSQITIINAGVYNIQFSAQLNGDGGADTVYIWLKKNGSNVAESATKQPVGNNSEEVMSVTFNVEAAANDYYELAWQSTNGDGVLLAETASGNIPAIPSVICSVNQVR